MDALADERALSFDTLVRNDLDKMVKEHAAPEAYKGFIQHYHVKQGLDSELGVLEFGKPDPVKHFRTWYKDENSRWV